MNDLDANALVDEYVDLLSRSPSVLNETLREDWHDSWYDVIGSANFDDPDFLGHGDLEAILQADLDEISGNASRREELQKVLSSLKRAQTKIVAEVVDHRLGSLGFTMAEITRMPPGSPRLRLLARAKADPGSLIKPESAVRFIVHVAYQFFPPDEYPLERQLQFEEGITLSAFQRQLQKWTMNWQIKSMMKCPDGLTSEHGCWFTWTKRGDPEEQKAIPVVRLDGPEAFAKFKAMMRSRAEGQPKLKLRLTHDRLEAFRRAALKRHEENLDRGGEIGDDPKDRDNPGAYLAFGFDRGLDFEAEALRGFKGLADFDGYDASGDVNDDRKDSVV